MPYSKAQPNSEYLIQVIGEVIDAKNKKPIPFAHIFVKNTNRQAVADRNGIFTVSVYRGDVVIVNSFGYDNRAFFIDNKSHKTDKVFIEVFLDPSFNMLTNVVVWGLTKENFKQAFVNEKISKSNIYPVKISVPEEKIYKVPETGVHIGLNNLIESLPLIKDMRQNHLNRQRHESIIKADGANMPVLPK